MEDKSLLRTDRVAGESSVITENVTAPAETCNASEANPGNFDCETNQGSSVAVPPADDSSNPASSSGLSPTLNPSSGAASRSITADAPTDSRENTATETTGDSTVAAAPAAAGANAIIAPAPTKIRVNLQAVGSAPILKKTKFAIGGAGACKEFDHSLEQNET